MNSINSDLEFTTESERDFDNKRLPTLSFEMWSTSEGISHSYFEKHMRSQVLTMRKSSMPETSKYSILVNELNRRFEVMSEDITVEERVNTVDKFTQQLVNSGFSYTQIKDIVLSSLKGEKKKEIKRKTKGGKRYLSSSETLQDRINKKLTEAVAWYREELRKEEREEIENDDMKREKGSWASWRKYKRKKKKPKVEKKGGKVDNGEEKIEYKTVIFIQHTHESSLAKRIREKLEKLEEAGGNIKIKIVERAGDKIVDLLHRSNPWDNIDCMRNDCLLCSTAGEKGRKGVCRRRNIVYETFCMNCGEVGEEDRGDTVNENIKLEDKNEALEEMVEGSHDKIEKISENENPEGEKVMKKRDYKYKYIGETCRSGYERGKEHLMMKENCNESSHMLKHCLLQHSDKDPMEIKFGMRVRQQFKTALERQVGEAVAILEERERGIQLLNSKSEFNRCSLPRITAGDTKEWLEKLQEEDAAEKKVKASIREMKKRKKREKKEKSPTLEEVCDEIIGENKERWKRRKLNEEVIRKLEEKEITRILEEEKERQDRLNRARKRKEEFLAKLARRKEIVFVKEGKSTEWIRRKQRQWREFRSKEGLDEEEELDLRNRIIAKIPERKIKKSDGGDISPSTLLPTNPLVGDKIGIIGGEGGLTTSVTVPSKEDPNLMYRFTFKKNWIKEGTLTENPQKITPSENKKARNIDENRPNSPESHEKSGLEGLGLSLKDTRDDLKPEKVTKIGDLVPQKPQKVNQFEAYSMKKSILVNEKGKVAEKLGQNHEKQKKSDRKNPQKFPPKKS